MNISSHGDKNACSGASWPVISLAEKMEPWQDQLARAKCCDSASNVPDRLFPLILILYFSVESTNLKDDPCRT